MTTWSTDSNDGMIAREDAVSEIKRLAESKGLSGAFKVYYEGEQIVTTNDLPERVNMDLVQVSAMMDQA